MNETKNKTDEFLYSIWNFFAASLSEKTRKNYYNVIKAYIKIPGISIVRGFYLDVKSKFI